MDNFEILRRKLESFIKKFYLNELLKGLIFFVAIGLLYFLLTLFIEYLLWLDPTSRTILFWTFVAVEVFLFVRFILLPVFKLFRISKGIGYTEASRIIGKHFPEVNDKLLNVLQLRENTKKSDLLMASIDQKASELKPVPFTTAVDFTKNLPFLKYAAVPILIILLIVFSGRTEVFSSSYERVVNYKMAYEPPAPFAFVVRNPSLKVQENQILNLKVSAEGSVIPENASIHYNGETYFLNQVSPGIFEHKFEPIREDFNFHLSGNGVRSKSYSVEVIEVPKMRNFKMILDYPQHTGLGEETVEGTGNATIPEGTNVSWQVATSATEEINMLLADSILNFVKQDNSFNLTKVLKSSVDYSISTSNKEVRNFENLAYSIRVVKDEYPELSLEHRTDSLDGESQYFYGKISDDYGISVVRMVAFPVDDPENPVVTPLGHGGGTVGEFLGQFPDTLSLERGKEYSFYFEVVDNDILNGYKRVKSKIFSYKRKTVDEEKEKRLSEQNEAIQGIDGSLEKMKDSENELQELSRLQKEKSELNYSDRKKLESFIKRQKQQNSIMESYTEKLKKTLKEEAQPQNEDLQKELQERLNKREEEIRENEKLLEELEKYSEKIQEEGLSEKLEELSRNSKNQERNLEQLLELTKRYYVQEKIQKISNDLQKLGQEQSELAEKEEGNTKEAQDSISEKTEEALEELEELQEENENLEKPLEMEQDKETEEEIQENQKNASENLEKEQKEDAKKQQKKAGEKLQEMSARMQQQMQMAGMEQMQEDADMLRKILDNLVTFSFEQEDLMEDFREMGQQDAAFANKIRRQDLLKEHFEHIDDSLYSLALRNQMITENITGLINDVDYNLQQSLDRLAQNEINQGVGSQQYVVTGANDLAYFLSNILGNMDQMLSSASSSSSGEGQQMQLQDIIKKQGELNEEMQKGMQKGKGENGEQKEEGGSGQSEEMNGELFRIFQEQQMLRRALEERLSEEGQKPGNGNLDKEIEEIEKEMLDKGFDLRVLEKMQQLEHKLLELEEAEFEQGKKQERESNTSKENFSNETKEPNLKAKEYFNTTEILNRQSLPLRQIYKYKVKEYFERRDN